MKRIVWILVTIVGFSKASAHSDQFWTSLNDDFVNVELKYHENTDVESRYPKILRTLLEGTLGWHPGTVLHMKTECDLSLFKSTFVNESVVSKKQAILQEYMDRCAPVFSKNNFMSGLKAISQRGSFRSHPFFKYSFLNFPGGIKTRAILGIKNQVKRDLIVVRPGIFSSVDELIAERYLLFILTELNDFHVVVLESSTSGDHIVNNEHGMIAGPKEAFENLYLIERLRKNKNFGPLIGKIHLMGMSLGANGVLLSSLVNQSEKHRYFDKTMLLCPVVDFKSSFSAQMQSGLIPFLLDWWSSRRFKDLEAKKDFVLTPAGALESFWSLTPRWVKSAWAWYEKKYKYQPTWQPYLSKDYYTGDFTKDFDFFNESTILPSHLYVIATKTDPIVHPDANYERLRSRANDDTFFYMFDYGFHCSFAYTYQWKFLDQFFMGILESKESESRKTEMFHLDVRKGIKQGPADSSDIPEIRSVEVSKLASKHVELLVYFLGHSHLISAHVRIPLASFALDIQPGEFDSEVVRNYIKRLVQTKAEIVTEKDRFFIKI